MIRSVALTFLAIALVGAAPARAEMPTATAKVGEPFSYSGLVRGQPASVGRGTPFSISDRDHDSCTLKDGVILWEPGVSTPGGVELVPTESGWNVNASGSHTFEGKIAVGAVDFTLTCDGNAQRHTYREWVDITVTGESEPGTCPIARSAQISQASCPSTYLQSEEKFLFRKLAKIAYDGMVVDKTLDDIFSAPEDLVKEILGVKDASGFSGTVKEWLVGKAWGKIFDKLVDRLPKRFGRYDWILDVPKYAGYLDLAKFTVLTRLANDPPDPDYAALASPPALRALQAVKGAGSRDRREVGLYIALLRSVERAGGAQAAGDEATEGAQLRHASGLASQLVALLADEQAALEQAVGTADRVRTVALPKHAVAAALHNLDSPAFRASAGKVLRELGFSNAELQDVSGHLPQAGVAHYTRSFEKVNDLDRQLKLVRAERAALATFANRYAISGS